MVSDDHDPVLQVPAQPLTLDPLAYEEPSEDQEAETDGQGDGDETAGNHDLEGVGDDSDSDEHRGRCDDDPAELFCADSKEARLVGVGEGQGGHPGHDREHGQRRVEVRTEVCLVVGDHDPQQVSHYDPDANGGEIDREEDHADLATPSQPTVELGPESLVRRERYPTGPLKGCDLWGRGKVNGSR